MRHWAALFAGIGLFGCAGTQTQETGTAPAVNTQAKLKYGRDVLIAMPKNAVHDQKEYRGSGQQTATAVQAAFSRLADSVVVLPRCADLPCLQIEGGSKYNYLVVPEILLWEDHKAEWSGKPDKVEVKVVIIDSRSSEVIDSAVIYSQSTATTLSGNEPQDLLPDPLKTYIRSLF